MEEESWQKLADETRLEEERGRTCRSQVCQRQIPSNLSNFVHHFSRCGTLIQYEKHAFSFNYTNPFLSSCLQQQFYR
jgi:hypothetical protein